MGSAGAGLIQYKKCKFETNKLTIDDNITVEEWKEIGKQLRGIEGSVQFWIGDWARHGDKSGFTGKNTDSKVYDELESITGLARKTIQNYSSVANNSSLRREELSYSHHEVVASQPPEKQEKLLNKAVAKGLSVRDLRDEVRGPVKKKSPVILAEIVEEPETYYKLPKTLPKIKGKKAFERITAAISVAYRKINGRGIHQGQPSAIVSHCVGQILERLIEARRHDLEEDCKKYIDFYLELAERGKIKEKFNAETLAGHWRTLMVTMEHEETKRLAEDLEAKKKQGDLFKK